MSAGHRFDFTLTITTTALCNASSVAFLGREKVPLGFCQAVLKFRQNSQSVFFAKLLFSGSSQLNCMLEMCSYKWTNSKLSMTFSMGD